MVPLVRMGTPAAAGPPRIVRLKLRTKLSYPLKFCTRFRQLSAPDITS